jgi:hypothetical protein
MGKSLWSNISVLKEMLAHPYRGSEGTNLFTGLAIYWLADLPEGFSVFFRFVLPCCFAGSY